MFKRIGIIGSGLMGSGIAQVSAQAGYQTLNYDINSPALENARVNVRLNLKKMVEKGKFTLEFIDTVLERMKYTDEISDLSRCDLVIEAVFENLGIKQELFRKLDGMLSKDVIIVSNTSALSITAIASVTKWPDRVMGTHFFSPVQAMKLLELVRGIRTSDETYEAIREFGQSINKIIVDAPDMPGFIVNRLLAISGRLSSTLIEQYAVSAEDVDETMKIGLNLPIGPVRLGDFTGLDVGLGCLTSLYEGLDDIRYKPSPVLKKMVENGYLGMKSKRGHFDYI